mgnify:CR=1 FL=1
MNKEVIIDTNKFKKVHVTIQYVFRANFNDTYYLEELIFNLDEINKVESGTTDDIIHNDPVSAGVTVMGETIRVTFNLRKGVEIYCNSKDIDEAKRLGCKIEQDIIIKDSTGKEIVIEDIEGYDYCIKNTCFIDLKEYSDEKGRKSRDPYLNYIINGTYNYIKRFSD